MVKDGNVAALQPDLAILQARKGTAQVYFPSAHRLNLCPRQHNPGFVGLIHEIIVIRLPVDGHHFYRFLLSHHCPSSLQPGCPDVLPLFSGVHRIYDTSLHHRKQEAKRKGLYQASVYLISLSGGNTAPVKDIARRSNTAYNRARTPKRRDVLSDGKNNSTREGSTSHRTPARAGCGLLANVCARDFRAARPGPQADGWA